MKNKTIIIGLAFVVFMVVSVVVYNNLKNKVAPENQFTDSQGAVGNPDTTNTTETNETKEKAPDFTVLDSSGKEVKLSQLFGKPLVVNFWASWCPPCKAEMPEFDKVHKELGDEVTFVMIDLVDGQRETVEKGKKYMEDEGLTLPAYFDTTQEAATTYGISSIPTSIFIDKDGYIVTGAQGALNEESLRKGIKMIQDVDSNQ